MGALLEEIGRREQRQEKAATLRAGLVAAAVYNVHRKKGTAPVKPKDFIREPLRKLSPEEMDRVFSRWMDSTNAGLKNEA